jgi:hypothetical protein
MEQVQNDMRRVGKAKEILAEDRAMELQSKRPQLKAESYMARPEPTEPQPRGGGDAGLARLVGRGKKHSKKQMEHESDDEMEGGGKHQGKMLGEHLKQLHGAGFLSTFAKGLLSAMGEGRAGAGMAGAGMAGAGVLEIRHGGRGYAGAGSDVSHAQHVPVQDLPVSGHSVPPGGLAPMTMGNAPQAPESFRRNQVGMGRAGAGRAGAGRAGAGRAGAGRAGAGMAGAGDKPKRSSERGQMISKLMKEHGMSLGEASKYLKEHGNK